MTDDVREVPAGTPVRDYLSGYQHADGTPYVPPEQLIAQLRADLEEARAERRRAERLTKTLIDAAVAEARREERAVIRHYFTAQLASGHTWTVGEIERALTGREDVEAALCRPPASAPEGEGNPCQ